MKALRTAVGPSINQWKREHPLEKDAVCPVLGIPLNRSNLECNHYKQCFQSLANTWMELERFVSNTPEIDFFTKNHCLQVLYKCHITKWLL
jgi:hypothetical protein